MSGEPARLRSLATGTDHPDLLAADAAAARYSDAATPANTVRTYTGAWRQFENWCATVDLAALPAAESTVERYLALGAERGRAASTLTVWTAAIAARHRDAGHRDPSAGPGVREILAGVRATRTRAGRGIGRAPAADHPVITAMITTAHTGARTWVQQVRARRDIAVLTTGYAMLARRSEVAALTITDLTPTTDAQRLLQIRLRGTKTDRGEISHVYIRPGAGPALSCPWCALHRWLAVLDARDRATARETRRQTRASTSADPAALARAAAVAVQRTLILDTADPGEHRCGQDWPELPDPTLPLFRPLAKAGPPHERAISDRQIARIIATRGAAAGYELKGHSLRAGGATEGFARGARLEDIMALGRWRNPTTALRYDRDRETRSARVDLGL